MIIKETTISAIEHEHQQIISDGVKENELKMKTMNGKTNTQIKM